MRIRNRNRPGFYISNSPKNALLTKDNDDIRDAFWFENPKEITKERYDKYIKELCV